MFKPVRVIATVIFLASIVLVFIAAFVLNSDVSNFLPQSVALTPMVTTDPYPGYVLQIIYWPHRPADPLNSVRPRRISGLHMVYTVVYTLRKISRSQSVWNELKISNTQFLASTIHIMQGLIIHYSNQNTLQERSCGRLKKRFINSESCS